MAGPALARHRRPVVVACAEPGGRIEVAGFAWRIGNNVRIVLGCRQDALADCMTTVTIFWGSLEHTADVAGFACRGGVPTDQREAGGHVVKVAAPRLSFSGYCLQRSHG